MPGKRIDKVRGKPVLLDTKVTNVRNNTSPFWRSALVDPARRCLEPFTTSASTCPVPRVDHRSTGSTSPAAPRSAERGAAFAFLTTEPSPLVAPVYHNAMPVLLDEGDELRWLTCGFDDAVALARPFPSQLMAMVQAGEPRDEAPQAARAKGGNLKRDEPELYFG